MKILVTGGGGFLGQAICRQLVARGDSVVSYNRSRYPELDPLGVVQAQGDLADFEPLFEAARGCEAIIHVGAKAGAWGNYDSYYRPNMLGTEHVLRSCREHRIERLVLTSSPSVTHRSTQPVEGLAADQVPYGEGFKAWYPYTKRESEKAVLAANSPELATVALRPRLIWGPGDNQLLPRLVERAKQGRLRLIGGGRNRIDTTYVDNAASAHLLALGALKPGAACAGRAYFVSNGEPRAAGDIINALLRAAGAPEVNASLGFRTAYLLGAVLEGAWHLLPLKGEPPMTRFLAEQLSTTHYYDMGPAQRDFGYRPEVSIDEGLKRLADAWRSASGPREGQSPVQ